MPKNLLSPIRIVGLIIALFLLSYAATNYESGKPVGDNFFFGGKNNQSFSANKQSFSANNTYTITNPEITGLPGRWAVAVKNLQTGETYLLNADEKFPSASLYKLAVMYKVYDAIRAGELAGDDIVSGAKDKLDQTASGVKIYQSPQQAQQAQPSDISYSVENATRLMITISDNYAALLLAERLGWQNIDKFLQNQGLGAIDLVEQDAPTATANAILALLERIYRRTAVDWQSSEEMQELLFVQKINDRIPKYLPEGTRVGHKTGELDGVRHDAGIIQGQKSDYIFVFLSETSNPTDAAESIAKLSKKIYDALEGNRP